MEYCEYDDLMTCGDNGQNNDEQAYIDMDYNGGYVD